MDTDRFMIELIRHYAVTEGGFSQEDDLVSLCDLALGDMTEENIELVFQELSEYVWIYDGWTDFIKTLGLIR